MSFETGRYNFGGAEWRLIAAITHMLLVKSCDTCSVHSGVVATAHLPWLVGHDTRFTTIGVDVKTKTGSILVSVRDWHPSPFLYHTAEIQNNRLLLLC